MRLSSRRVLAAAVIALMLLPFVAPARAQYMCRMTGHLLAARCCQAGAAHRDALCAGTAQVSSTECCELLSPARLSVAPAVRDTANHVPPAALVGAVTNDLMLTPTARTAHRTWSRREAPALLGPPLFIVHCALLN